jgi:hypothetical protein
MVDLKNENQDGAVLNIAKFGQHCKLASGADVAEARWTGSCFRTVACFGHCKAE